jgi:serine/threonine-protein kinase
VTTPLPAPSAGGGLGTQKILALVSGGVGVIGVGVGTAFGIIAISKKNNAQSICPGAECPTQAGSSDWSNAGSAGNVSTIGFIVGGIGLAGAAPLWFTAPRGGATSAAQVGLGPGSLHVTGTW